MNRPYHIAKIYKKDLAKLKFIGFTEYDIFNDLITDSEQLILKIDEFNYITNNKYPYSRPNNTNQYIS